MGIIFLITLTGLIIIKILEILKWIPEAVKKNLEK